MTEKTNQEVLKDFARKSGRELIFKEKQYPVSGIRKIPKFRTIAYIPNNSEGSSYFVFFNDPYKKIGVPCSFCGAFIPVSIPKNIKASIRKRDFMDNMSFKKNSFKTGTSSFDSKFVIEASDTMHLQRLFSNSEIQKETFKALNNKEFLKISINEFDLDFVPELQNRSYLAIINPLRWVLEKDFIEGLFHSIEAFRKASSKGVNPNF